jgi:hypothetical protein
VRQHCQLLLALAWPASGLAVRAAIGGAGCARRQLIAEAALLAAAGGGLGVVLSAMALAGFAGRC